MLPNDPNKIVTRPLEPIVIPVIGGTGDGETLLKNGQVLTTPDHQPNVQIRAVSTVLAVVVRFVNAYLSSLVTAITIGMTSDLITAKDFTHLVLKCASYALAGPAIASIKDVITILSNLEKKYPLWTGNV